MKLYLLYIDKDTGNREDWSVFYTPLEIFDNVHSRNERQEYLKMRFKGEKKFHTDEIDLMHHDSVLTPPPWE